MSLLMDALKRAEKARQAEAERAKAEGRAAADPELSLDPMEDSAARPAAPGAEPEPAPREVGMDTEDSLEFTPDAVRRAVESMPDPVFDDSSVRWEGEAPPGPGPTPEIQDSSPSLSLDYADIPPDDTGSTMPSMRAAQRSVQDYFDGTHSVSMSMEDVREAIESEGGAIPAPEPQASTGTIDGDTTTRQRAQAVLDARAVAPSNTARNAMIILVLLLVVGGIAGGAFMYRDQIMAVVGGQPTVIARPAPPAPPPARAAAPARVAAADQPAVVAAEERDALLRAAEQAREEERRVAQAAAGAQARAEEAALAQQAARAAALAEERQAQAAAAQAAAARVPPPAAAARATPAAGGSGSRTGADVALADVLRGAPQAAPAPPPSAFKISRTGRASRTHRKLMEAFDAFQRGDDGQAMQAYQRVLSRAPRNRDAQLGVAALYVRAGEVERAAVQYAQVLSRNPRDAAAQAGLIALQENLDPIAGEARLKGLLARSPGDAYLLFTLGNLYSEQGRWAEAQQAYFDAYRLDDANPDYAFNLAVSLDRLSQRKAALGYYRRAVELAGRYPATFEPAAAQRRAAELAGS